jgi:hypothetical protein
MKGLHMSHRSKAVAATEWNVEAEWPVDPFRREGDADPEVAKLREQLELAQAALDALLHELTEARTAGACQARAWVRAFRAGRLPPKFGSLAAIARRLGCTRAALSKVDTVPRDFPRRPQKWPRKS